MASLRFVEKQVEDTEIGQKTVFLLIYLIIFSGDELWVVGWMFWVDGIAKIHVLPSFIGWKRSAP